MTFHADWERWQTGGGCQALAWGPEPDARGRHRLYIMATVFDGGALPEPEADVMVGFYDDRERDSEGDAFIRVPFDEFQQHGPGHWFQVVRERGVPDAIDLYREDEPRHGDGSDSGPDAPTIWPQGVVVELPPADADRAVACVNALAGLDPTGINVAVATLRTLAHASDLPAHQRALAAAALDALQPPWGSRSVGDGEAAG